MNKDLVKELEFMSNPEPIEITLKGIRKLEAQKRGRHRFFIHGSVTVPAAQQRR
jgi:hypothetical protein